MSRALLRRPVTVGAVLFAAVLLLVLLPVWFIVSSFVDLLRRQWRLPTTRLLGFALLWTWLELAGVGASVVLWSVGKSRSRGANYALQRWWAARLIGALRVTCGFVIDVHGIEALGDGPLVVLGRHASLGDALVSAWALGSLADRTPRYVLKKELSLDPCLDIVGRRLPNYFVDRSSARVSRELEGIATLSADLRGRDVAVIFPEGTRSNDKKRSSALERMRNRDPLRAERLADLQHLLPPKPAGAQALLDAAPGASVALMWHIGFDGLDTFGRIRRRLAAGRVRAQVVFEMHDRATVPTGDEFVEWLDRQWMELDRSVAAAFSAAQARHPGA
jgi:1-acyl-sn-glycerol-3-phosphate acyltransferase